MFILSAFMAVAYAGVLSGHGATSYANNNLDASHSIEQYNHEKDYYVILHFASCIR